MTSGAKLRSATSWNFIIFFVVCDLYFRRMTGAATDELEQAARSAATGAETSSQRNVFFET